MLCFYFLRSDVPLEVLPPVSILTSGVLTAVIVTFKRLLSHLPLSEHLFKELGILFILVNVILVMLVSCYTRTYNEALRGA